MVETTRQNYWYFWAGQPVPSMPLPRGTPHHSHNLLSNAQSAHRSTDLHSIYPTRSHMAITELYNRGHISFVVTSNHDNLHKRAGIPDNAIAELFGNMNPSRTRWRQPSHLPNLPCCQIGPGVGQLPHCSAIQYFPSSMPEDGDHQHTRDTSR